MTAVVATNHSPDLPLEACTERGRHAVGLASGVISTLRERAPKYDHAGSFPFDNIRDLHACGVLRATVPEDLGGLGVAALRDLAVCIERLARGDGSTAIGANMHLAVVWAMAREWRTRRAAGGEEEVAGLESLLRSVAAGSLTISVLVSERGAGFLDTRTEAAPVEGGWRVQGRKLFGTLSSAAGLFVVAVRLRAEGREDRLAFAYVPRETEGLEVLDNWDALGMRASGSNDVVLHDCFVPAPLVVDLGTWGRWNSRLLEGRAAGNIGLLGAFLGIAEAARQLALDDVRSNADRVVQPATRHAVGELEIALAAARAGLQRGADALDGHFARHPEGPAPLVEAHAAMKHFQCAKWTVNRRAIEVVDRAMTLSGGRSYARCHPLSRLYRDVRAGPFMQPFQPPEALQYIGAVALGEPDPR